MTVRHGIMALAAAGLLLFGGAFVVSWFRPLLVERAARELLRIEVERRVGARIDELSDARITALGRTALAKVGLDVDSNARALREQVPRKTAEVISDMLNADCACRLRLRAALEAGAQDRLASLLSLQERFTALVESSYNSVRHSLVREFRIFTLSNAMAFALLGLVAFTRKQAKLQLVLPALALVVAVALVGGLYLFNQDWLHTIVFGEYVGWGYAAYLSAVALLLADILMNRARVSTQLVNLALNAAGSAATAVPC